MMKKYTDYKKIALYGTGAVSKRFIAEYSKLPIYCVIDQKFIEGTFGGFSIMPLEHAINNRIDLIIILASIRNEKIIYDRISPICKEKNIALMDCFENDLKDTFENNFWGYSSEEDISLEVLENEILSHDVISFDIFDTLLMRMTLTPEDVFDIVGYRLKQKGLDVPEFKMNRMLAERRAANNTLEGIYSELQQQLCLSEKDCVLIKNEEIAVEKEVIIPRSKIVEVYNKAKSLNKKIYLVSDMYLPEDILSDILRSNGISGYEGLLVSGYEGVSKYNGLFDLMKGKAKGLKYLHIGDNKEVDGLAAKVYGVDAFVIPSSISFLYKYAPYMYFSASTINERSLLGLYISIKYNNPFVKLTDGKIDQITIFDYCRCFIAPLVTVFMVWLLAQISQPGYKKILFAARDGYIFSRLYKKYNLSKYFSDLPDGVYFFTSRKAALNSGLENNEDIEYVKEKFGNDILGKIFRDNISVSDNQGVIELSKKYRRNYTKYLNNNGIKLSESAFVDLISSGTSQLFLQKTMKEKACGYYLARLLGIKKEDINIRSMMFKSFTDINYLDLREVFILESVLTSPDASLVCFDEDGVPVFDSDIKDDKQRKWLQECFDGIEAFYADYVNKLYIPSVSLRSALGEMLFFSHHDVTEEKENELFSVVSFMDNLINKFVKKKVRIY